MVPSVDFLQIKEDGDDKIFQEALKKRKNRPVFNFEKGKNLFDSLNN